jgi:hypothetical protein
VPGAEFGFGVRWRLVLTSFLLSPLRERRKVRLRREERGMREERSDRKVGREKGRGREEKGSKRDG